MDDIGLFISDSAACMDVPVERWDYMVLHHQSAAKAICAECPVIQECRDFADSFESGGVDHYWGVWGGETPTERAARRKTSKIELPPWKSNDKQRDSHCARGHEWSEENTYYDVNGWRQCRSCRRENRKKYRKQKNLTCTNGHAWSDGNYVLSAKGVRICTSCQLERNKARKKRTHCKHGHPLTDDNVRYEKRGNSRIVRCKTCARGYR